MPTERQKGVLKPCNGGDGSIIEEETGLPSAQGQHALIYVRVGWNERQSYLFGRELSQLGFAVWKQGSKPEFRSKRMLAGVPTDGGRIDRAFRHEDGTFTLIDVTMLPFESKVCLQHDFA